jgi:Pyruvate/2-oxoacid:ferredoxin oxidoreductase delta subunit
MQRKIVYIDESLCDGCGHCISGCVEQALQIVEGKAKIVKDIYCDGLGACLGHCPQGAITIVEREAEAFNQEEVHKYINSQTVNAQISSVASVTLQKSQWPIKIDLVLPKAPFFENANILFVADCVPVVFKDFQNIAKGKQVIIGCPKFNDAKAYAVKMSEILKLNNIATIAVVRMEVPCCAGLKWVVKKALEDCGKKVLTQEIEVKVGGESVELKW